RDVANLAFQLTVHRVFFDKSFPGIGQRLLQTKADPAFLWVDVEYHYLDLLTGRDDLSGVHILLGPAHLRDMDQPFDPRLQFDKGAVICDIGDAAAEFGSGRIFEFHTLPRIGLELLHAERDTLSLGVEANDLDLDGLTNIKRLRGVVDPSPGD